MSRSNATGRVQWEPRDLGLCEAQFLSTWGVLASAGLVYQWVDRAKGRDLVQEWASGPALIDPNPTYNGKPTFRFHHDTAPLSSAWWAAAPQPTSWYWVGHSAGDLGEQLVFDWIGEHGLDHVGPRQRLLFTDAGEVSLFAGSTIGTAAGCPEIYAPFVMRMILNGAGSSVRIYQAGVATELLAGDAGANGLGSIRLGFDAAEVPTPSDLDVAALVVYSRLLTGAENDKLIKYLGQAYGIDTGVV